MIIKPNWGARLFWGAAGVTMIILACTGLAIPFPGLLFTCLGLPVAIFSFGYAFGAAQTRIDDEGIFQRNFFLLTKKFLWNEIEAGEIVSQNYNYTDSSGWTSRRIRTYVIFLSKNKRISMNVHESGPENWWNSMREIAKEKLGERFK